jgi:hypothetical protein
MTIGIDKQHILLLEATVLVTGCLWEGRRIGDKVPEMGLFGGLSVEKRD